MPLAYTCTPYGTSGTSGTYTNNQRLTNGHPWNIAWNVWNVNQKVCPMTPKTENQSAFAARLGVNRATVSRAVAAGRVVMADDGKVLIEPSLQRWHETKGHRTDMAEMHAKKRGQTVTNAPRGENAAPDISEGGESNRTRYKALLLHFENQSIKLEIALRRHARYPLEQIRHEATGLGAMLRASIERVIDQTAPRLAVSASKEERRRLLASELATLRRHLKAEFPAALRRMRKAGQ